MAFNEVGIDIAHNLCPTRFRGQRTSVRWLDVRSSYCLESGFIELLQREGFNIPSRAELYLYPPSNTGLQPELLWSYELSWTHRILPGRLHYGINLFCIHTDNIIQTVNRLNVNTGELKNRGMELDLQYRISPHWSVNTNHAWLHMQHPVVSAPKYKGYMGATMHYGRWSAGMGLMQVSGPYTAVGEAAQTENFTLLIATVDYALCRPVRLWLRGENLLAQRYEYIADMPMPRATFMGGIQIEF